MEDPLTFFDFTKPCPEKIPDCEKLRETFKEDLLLARGKGGCNSCQERQIRNRYIQKIIELTQ